MKTIRLYIPDWQAGLKPAYWRGNQLLHYLVPENAAQKSIDIEVPEPPTDIFWDSAEELEERLGEEHGVIAQSAIHETLLRAKAAIAGEQPDRIVTLGGNCIVSQAPVDYLNGRYDGDLGVIWFDAHPDISTPEIYNHEHAMVLGNLLGAGDPAFAADVEHPLEARQVFYAGLQPLTEDEPAEMEKLGLSYQTQEDGLVSGEAIAEWIRGCGFSHVFVHWDIDVLDPAGFHSQYFAEPDVPMFTGSSHGIANIREVVDRLKAIQETAEVVGFTLAEYIPWDAIRVQDALAELDIFNA